MAFERGASVDSLDASRGKRPGRILAIRLLPAAAAVVPTATVLCYLGQRAGYFRIETSLALLAGSVIVCLVALVARTATILERGLAERQAVEAQSRTRERMFQALIESAPDALVLSDHTGRIAFVNKQADKLFGYPSSALVGRHVELLMPERLRDAHVLRRSLYQNDPRPRPMASGLTLTARRADGSEFPVEISLAPFDAGETTFVVSVVRDVSERRQIEENLLQAQKLEAVGQLAAGIAHDFNNLLTAIGGYASLLVHALVDRPELRYDAEQITHAIETGSKLTRQLLAFTRPDPHQPQLTDLAALCRRTENMLRLSLGEQTEVEIHCDEEPLLVRIDPSLVEQVLLNLALNSHDAMPEGGKLLLSLSRVESGREDGRPFVQLAISDSGTGMDEETRNRAFEPFYTTKERDHGTGLGLVAVQNIIAQADGVTRLTSTPGTGTTVTILLPDAAEDTAAPAPAAVRESSAHAHPAQTHRAESARRREGTARTETRSGPRLPTKV